MFGVLDFFLLVISFIIILLLCIKLSNAETKIEGLTKFYKAITADRDNMISELTDKGLTLETEKQELERLLEIANKRDKYAYAYKSFADRVNIATHDLNIAIGE
jgi:NAD-dependent DNA ligase